MNQRVAWSGCFRLTSLLAVCAVLGCSTQPADSTEGADSAPDGSSGATATNQQPSDDETPGDQTSGAGGATPSDGSGGSPAVDPAPPDNVPAGMFRISGALAPEFAPKGATAFKSAVTSRTVTHVMALNPETASPERVLAELGADGGFTLDVNPGRPYVLVFIDSSAVGTDMVVGIFRAETLDTLAPLATDTMATLGEVAIDEDSQTATAGTSYADLLVQLGLSEAGAEYLGAIDDLSLRYANPDIDANGVIDATEDLRVSLDFHLRANVRMGPLGPNVRFADMTDQFFAETGDMAATPVFNLCSIYTLYPAAFDMADYVADPPSGGLANGASFNASHSDGSPVIAQSSFSELAFGDTRGWGPDYSMEQDGVELPGSAGAPATLEFTLGATATTLTFSNVVTRTKASLTDEGTLMPFLKLNTESGIVTSLDYQWMKRASDGWALATSEEIDLVVNDNGGYAVFYRGSKSSPIGFQIPADPSGTLPWTREAASEVMVTDEELANTTPDDLCSSAVSYDDKLGLRIFAGGADPNEGVAPCY